MKNDKDLNLHLHDQMSGWLRYWSHNNSYIAQNDSSKMVFNLLKED